jgi:hypothetical protein
VSGLTARLADFVAQPGFDRLPEAARLAQARLTAPPDALEHSGGFVAALSPAGRVDRTRPAAVGERLAMLESGLSIKQYPRCYATHRVIDGVLDLARTHGVEARQVTRIEAVIGDTQAAMLRNHAPVTAPEVNDEALFERLSRLETLRAVGELAGAAQVAFEFRSRTLATAASRGGGHRPRVAVAP